MPHQSDLVFHKIGWGSYSEWEGPFFRGSVPFRLSTTKEPSFLEKVLAVITATEGGAYDAYNGYDRCRSTVGIIQWGEECASGRPVSRMVSLIRTKEQAWVDSLLGEARLRVSSNRPEIVTLDDDRSSIAQTFLACSGKKGAYTDSTKAYAKRVAAVLVTMFADPRSHQVQLDYTMPRLMDFTYGQAKAIMFPAGFKETGYEGAARAIYLSFAANLPAVAAKRITPDTLKGDPKAACIALAKRLTFEPGIAIYPGRYTKIRPVIEKLFGVDLPDLASDLKAWHASSPHLDLFPNTKSWQTCLLSLGYDLGPAGADGKDGPKTRAAVTAFQRDQGLTADGLVGRQTLAALANACPTGTAPPSEDRTVMAALDTDSPVPVTQPQTPSSKSSQKIKAITDEMIKEAAREREKKP